MASSRELKLQLLPRNSFFAEAAEKVRYRLGIPIAGVPSEFVEITTHWLFVRGWWKDGQDWPLAEYLRRVKNPDEWWNEIQQRTMPKIKELEVIGNRLACAYGVPKRIVPAIISYIVNNDKLALQKACAELISPEIRVERLVNTQVRVTLTDVDPDMTISDWKDIFDKVKAELNLIRSDVWEGRFTPTRAHRNLERDFFFFDRHSDGFTFEEAIDEWSRLHPDDSETIDLASARQANDRMLDLLMPNEEWTIGYDKFRKRYFNDSSAAWVRQKRKNRRILK